MEDSAFDLSAINVPVGIMLVDQDPALPVKQECDASATRTLLTEQVSTYKRTVEWGDF